LALLLGVPGRADASRDRPLSRFILGVAPSYAFVVLADRAEPDGGGVQAFLQVGISEAVALHLSVLWSGHRIAPSDKRAGGLFQVFSAGVGLAYRFDAGPVEPVLEAAIGVLHQRFGDTVSTSLALQAGLALDYPLLPWLAVGAGFHYHAYLADPSRDPVYFDAGPRISVRF